MFWDNVVAAIDNDASIFSGGILRAVASQCGTFGRLPIECSAVLGQYRDGNG